jgi:hypothetical protein
MISNGERGLSPSFAFVWTGVPSNICPDDDAMVPPRTLEMPSKDGSVVEFACQKTLGRVKVSGGIVGRWNGGLSTGRVYALVACPTCKALSNGRTKRMPDILRAYPILLCIYDY